MNKLQRLEIYAKHLQERLAAPVPPKHAARPESLREYLNKELSITKGKIEALKLGSTGR